MFFLFKFTFARHSSSAFALSCWQWSQSVTTAPRHTSPPRSMQTWTRESWWLDAATMTSPSPLPGGISSSSSRTNTCESLIFFLEKRDLTKWRNEFFPALSFVDSPRYSKTSYCIPSLCRFLVSSFLQIFDANRFRILEIPKTFPEPLFVFYLLRKH